MSDGFGFDSEIWNAWRELYQQLNLGTTIVYAMAKDCLNRNDRRIR